jgi:hypothetical protein
MIWKVLDAGACPQSARNFPYVRQIAMGAENFVKRMKWGLFGMIEAKRKRAD